jgi:hypothetical protein
VKRALLALAALAGLLPFGIGASGATFVAATSNPGASFTTAADFNTVTVTLGDPGSPLRGTVTLSADASSERGIANVRFQASPAGANTWSDVCTDATAAYSCAWNPADGLYDLRALATDTAGYTRSATVATRRIDNTAPSSATLTDPGALLSGTVTLAASAADAGSGIATVRIERAPAGTSTWTTICTDNLSPYSCSFVTTNEPDALYDLRAVATDAAGNTRTSATVANRRVDNAGPTVTVTDPGSPLRGSVTVAALASDAAGIASVTIQHKLTSGSTWTTICTDNSAPYSCAWATSGDGSYDLRATATDTVGRSTTSATVTGRVVDNTAPTATDVQAVNGSGTQYRIDSGDTLTFTYSEAMAPGSILAGWSGASQAVTVQLTNSGSADLLRVMSGTTKLNLTGTTDLTLNANHVTASAVFNATVAISGNRVVVTIGTVASGSSRAVTTTAAMRWTPAAATDLAGNPGSTTAVDETGTADRDF